MEVDFADSRSQRKDLLAIRIQHNLGIGTGVLFPLDQHLRTDLFQISFQRGVAGGVNPPLFGGEKRSFHGCKRPTAALTAMS